VGRIFNPATQQYVRHAEVAVDGTNLAAFSGDDGAYLLSNVPVGEAAVSVTYTGYHLAVGKVAVQAGQMATRDFDFRLSIVRPFFIPAWRWAPASSWATRPASSFRHRSNPLMA
jgi:hypothetical protein